MRETVGSVRAYFVIIGVLNVVSCFLPYIPTHVSFVEIPIAVSWGILFLVVLPLSTAYVYAGVTLPRLLRESPGVVQRILYVNAALSVIIMILWFVVLNTAWFRFWVWVQQGIGLLILYYLSVNVRRLVATLAAANPGSDSGRSSSIEG